MKKTIILSTGLFFILNACAANSSNEEPGTVNETNVVNETVNQEPEPITQNINADEFGRLIKEKPGTILDVRTAGEYNGGNIEGSINIDFYSSDFSEQLDDLDKSKPIYVYCKSGGRSNQAMKILEDKGFTVYNLIGGYNSWIKNN